MVKRVLLQDFWYIIITELFFLSLSKEWGLLLNQRIKSAKLVFKTERHFPQYNWKFYLPQYFVHDGSDKGSLLLCSLLFLKGFPGSSVVKNLPANAGDRFSPWVGKIPWRRKWQPTPVFLPGESPWIEEPVRLQSLGSQSWTRLSMHVPLFLKAIKTSYMKPTWWDISLVYFFFFFCPF